MIATTKTLIIDGEFIEIKRLSLNDLQSIGDAMQTQKETIARQIAKEEKLDKYELINLIVEIRRQQVTMNEILNSTATPAGATNIIKKSMIKSGLKPELQNKVLDHNIPDLIEIAKMLILDVHEEPTPEQKEPNESFLSENPSTSEPSGQIVTETEKVVKESEQFKKVAEALATVNVLGGKK